VVIALVVTGWLAYKVNTDSSVGQIKQGTPGPARNPKIDKPDQTFTGKYIQFMYPGDYSIIPSKAPSGRLEVVELRGVNPRSRGFVASVHNGVLQEDSAVKFRRSQKNLYKEEIVLLGEKQGIAFTKTESGFERAVFIANNGLIASLVITDDIGHDRVEDLKVILDSFAWL
jgi:hypothetical protein